MKNYKIFVISFILLFFMVGAVSATVTDGDALVDDELVSVSADESISVNDESVVSADGDSNVKEIYVNDTGDDSNTGSKESPYATLDKAFSDLSASDETTVYLSKGTFLTAGDYYYLDYLNHKDNGGNLKIIGEGPDKTFIDGQSMPGFIFVGYGSDLTLQNISFINMIGEGAVVSMQGKLTVENCVFQDDISYASGCAINFMDYDQSNDLTVKNSKFISDSAEEMGGAIYASAKNVYIEDNTFTSCSSNFGGSAIYVSTNNKASVVRNKFTDLNGNSVYVSAPDNTVQDNVFENCVNPNGVIVELGVGNVNWKNNTFMGCSAQGSYINCYGNIANLKYFMNDTVINISENEINQNYVFAPVEITDDVGNTFSTNSFRFKFIGEENNYTYNPATRDGVTIIQLNKIPKTGIYNLSIYHDGIDEIFATVNVSLPDAVELWVSPEGFDGNNGTKDDPFATIQHAIDVGFENTFELTIHLLKGTYSGTDNVKLTIANKGNLNIVGEKYGEVIIDGNNTDWFLSVSNTNVNIENLKFINGMSTSRTNLISGNYKVFLKDCIFDNNTVSGERGYTLYSVLFDNLTYTNNYGRMYFESSSLTDRVISNSYIADNSFINLNSGGIVNIGGDLIIENCKFVNNTATMAGVIYVQSGLTSKNNYFANNKAEYYPGQTSGRTGYNGVIRTGQNGVYTFENDVFVNNSAANNGVIGTEGVDTMRAPFYNFTNCSFIDNSAEKAGVTTMGVGNFDGCKFINNTADYGGAIILFPCVSDYEFTISDCIFDNNKAKFEGNDIYLTSDYINPDAIYAIPLTINFNNSNVSSLADDLFAYVVSDAQISGGSLNFMLNGTKIGTATLKDSVAIFNYAGFEDGQYVLSGNLNQASPNNIINDGIVNVKLEGIVDSVESWVSTNGSDENGNGSEANPYKSISYAIVQSTKISRNIIIHILEGTYDGDLNTGLTLSSMNNITLVGEGIDKTIIDGENSTFFAKVTDGKNKVVISSLTIKNMLDDNRESKVIANIPAAITIIENSTLCLDNVMITGCHGAQAVIENNGNLFINNSDINRNGFTQYGIIYGGNVVIDNSVIAENFAKEGLITSDLAIINNSIIKNAFNLDTTVWSGGLYSLICGPCIIENTEISNDGDNSSLKSIGLDEVTNSLVPALSIENAAVLNNVSMINAYGSPIDVREMTYLGKSPYLSAFGYEYAPSFKNVTVTNSTFRNFKYLWVVNTYYDTNFEFDGCLFDNITYLARSLTISETSKFSFNNSVFLNIDPVVDRTDYSHRLNPTMDFNNNYWSNNSQPVIKYMDGANVLLENIPDTWIALYSEDNETIIKNVTDGENSTAYTGNAPIRTDYADNHGNLGYAVVFGDVGYIIATDNETNVILNPENEIYPFVAADPMDYRTPSTIAITGFAGDLGIVCVLVDPAGNPIANATILSIINGENVANVTTDENGAFTVKGIKNGVLTLLFNGTDDYFDTEYNLTFTDAGKTTKSFIYLNIIEADLAVKGTLVDDEGSPIANAVITYTINGENATNVTTDTDGVFQVQGASNSIVDIVFAGSEGADAANTTLIIKDVAPTVVRLGSQFNVTEGVSIKTYAVDSKAGEVGQTTSFKLTDSNGNPIVNATVKFAYKTVILNRTTDENGIVFIGINTQLAQEALCAMSYLGDENYNATFVAFSFDIQKKPITITAPAKTYKASVKTKKYTVTLKTEKCNSLDGKVYLSAGKKVTMKINGKTYTAKTNANGQATFNLKITKKGKFSGTVKFAGDKTYASASKSVKITIK